MYTGSWQTGSVGLLLIALVSAPFQKGVLLNASPGRSLTHILSKEKLLQLKQNNLPIEGFKLGLSTSTLSLDRRKLRLPILFYRKLKKAAGFNSSIGYIIEGQIPYSDVLLFILRWDYTLYQAINPWKYLIAP